MKTTTKNKENQNEKRQETQRQAEVQTKTVLTVIEPAGGSVVVSDQPVRSLIPFRMVTHNSLKAFENDLAELFHLYLKKSGESEPTARQNFFEYVAYCDKAEVFFFIATDINYKCQAYCIAHAMPNGIFFIRQAAYNPGFEKSFAKCWQYIQESARAYGCGAIEANTKRNEKAYSRWARKIGMERDCTVYRKGIGGN